MHVAKFVFGQNSMNTLVNHAAAAASSPSDAVAAASSSILSSSSRPLTLLSNLQSSPQVVGAAWLISSAVFTTYSTTKFLQFAYEDDLNSLRQKMVKTELPFHHHTRYLRRLFSLPPPSMLTLWRFLGSLILGVLLHPDFEIVSRVKQTWDLVPNMALPAAFLFVANMANSVALDRIGISLTYTAKCGIPLFTVLLTVLMDGAGALPNAAALASLIPIALGIAAASWNSPTFELLGFIAAVVSATSQSALNVTSKRAISKTGVTGPIAQRSMVAVGLLITIVMNVMQAIRTSQDEVDTQEKLADIRDSPPFWLTSLAVTAYHLEYILSFTFVKLVQPITYGTCDAIRRLCIIMAGRQFFGGDRLTRINIGGIALALIGALCYSIASTLK